MRGCRSCGFSWRIINSLASRSISVLRTWKDVFSLSVLVEDIVNNSRWLLTSVYGPNDSHRRKELWRAGHNKGKVEWRLVLRRRLEYY